MRLSRALHFRKFLAWLAIIAILIGGLLPTAVTAVADPGSVSPIVAFCGGKTGTPAEHPASLPCRHCALCGRIVLSLTPGHGGFLIADHIAYTLIRPLLPPPAALGRPNLCSSSQPRGPPPAV